MPQGNGPRDGKVNNSTVISRRQLLISGSAAGAGLASTPQVLGDTLGNVRIVTKRQQGDVHTTRKVPKKWRQHVLRSRNAYDKTVDRLTKEYTGLEFARKATDSTIQGLNKLYIEVALPESKSEVAKEIPEQIDGIPVKTAEQKERAPMSLNDESYGCYTDEERNSVPGGSPCHSSAGDRGTMGFQAYVNGDSQYMMTASHVVHKNGCNNSHTMEYYDNRIGEVYAYDPVEDWALVSKDYYDVNNISGNIVNTDDSSMWYVDSYFSKSGLEYCMSNDTILNKQGRVHGNLTGEIESLNDSKSDGCIDMNGDGVGARIWTSEGDSGGPIYQQYDGTYATIAFVLSMGWYPNFAGAADCNGATEYKWSVGWPMYKVQGRHGIDIGNPRDAV